ncbi:MAG: hypothetical protein CVV02_09165 [Firmicutes bacterium HGW-Firmicutes-7]|nr:MAG: hypothetical protein CVV02_09165 [Firmicutes bacterium HGW-Firmicutes-7]
MENGEVKDISFHSESITISSGNEYSIDEISSEINVEIIGTATSSTIVFEGSVNNSWIAIMAQNLTTLAYASQTTGKNEIWQVNLTGLSGFRCRIARIGGGNLSVSGRVWLSLEDIVSRGLNNKPTNTNITVKAMGVIVDDNVSEIDFTGENVGVTKVADGKVNVEILPYTHPDTHPPSMIVQDANNRFTTDEEKAIWSAKSDFDGDYDSLNNKPLDVSSEVIDARGAYNSLNERINSLVLGEPQPIASDSSIVVASNGTPYNGAEFQNAMNQLSTSGGGTIKLVGKHYLTQSINIKSNIHIIGMGNAIITGASSLKPFVCSKSDEVKSVIIENITFDRTYQNELEFIEGITITRCNFLNITGNGIGWLRGCKNVKINKNLINVTLGNGSMGIKVEGTAAGNSDNILITENIVMNTFDNGLAVRAINNSIHNIVISNNVIVNAGKAGIKLTIEVASALGVEVKRATISGNIINGWGKNQQEDAISANCYLADCIYENVTITGNSMETNDNVLQRNYIGVSRGNKVTISNNIGIGKTGWSGIFLERTTNAIIDGNYIEGASQDNNLNHGGIGLLQESNNNIVSNNNIKNCRRSGITIYKSNRNLVTNNKCFDDQAVKTQTYGIEENDNGGSPNYSKNNIFGGNYCYDNVIANYLISNRSQQYNNY